MGPSFGNNLQIKPQLLVFFARDVSILVFFGLHAMDALRPSNLTIAL
jgi:hypothetical protein